MAGGQGFTPEQLHNISRNVKDAVYWFYHDYCEIFAAEPVMTMVDPGYDFFTSIVMDSDLSDNRYLYRYGSFIGENELRMADFLRGLPEEKIAAMARTSRRISDRICRDPQRHHEEKDRKDRVPHRI